MFGRFAALAMVLSLTGLALAEPAGTAKTDEKTDTGEKTAKVAETAEAPVKKATVAEIAQWVKDLDSETFTVREKAVASLAGAGAAAVEPTAKAARGTSLEVSARAVKVLSMLLTGKDAKARAAAKAALEELAKDEKHPASHMAWKALQEANPAKSPAGMGADGQIVIGGNVINIGGGAMRVQVAMRNVNGNKEVEVDENGKKVKISEDKNGITVTVTDPAQGDKKAAPKTYKAADAKELKKKHPEAHKLYEKYAGGQGAAMGNIQIIGGLGGGAINPLQIGRAVPAFRGRAGRLAKSGKLIDDVQKQLDEALAKIKASVKAGDKGEKVDLPELIKQLEAARKGLAEARKGLGR